MLVCFEAADDEWWVVEPLGILAGIAEDRGDLDRAASAYEAVVERSRTVGGEFFEPRWMSRLAGVRARQGNEAEADRLYRDTIAQGRNPLLTASALVAQASVARRLGDLPRSRRLLDDGMARFELLGVAAGCAAALAGLAWWALAAGDPAGAASFAERARSRRCGAGTRTPSSWRRAPWRQWRSSLIPRSSTASSLGRSPGGGDSRAGSTAPSSTSSTSPRWPTATRRPRDAPMGR